MNEIEISGVAPYDGRYELDLGVELTTREWGWMKRLAGYLPLAVDEQAFGDPELVCVLAVIAMRRAGRIQPAEVPGVFERLADAPFGSSVTFITDQEEEAVEADPPASSSSNGVTPGTSSPAVSAIPASGQSPIGSRGSGTSGSAPATSVR